METARVAHVLEEMGIMLEIQGVNPFRCRAYHNASQALRGLPDDLSEMIADGSLEKIPGVGESMYQKISKLVTSGSLPEYDKLLTEITPGMLAMLRIPGLGPKKVKALRDQLEIKTLPELKAAAQAGRIAGLKGFGAKTEQKILEGIDFVESLGDRVLQSTALRLAVPLLESVREQPSVKRAELCGSLRRRKETIGDIDLLFSSTDPAPVLEAFTKRPEVAVVLGLGPTKASVRLVDGVQCDVRGVSDDQFAFALHYFTGSKEHNIAMRRRAQDRQLKLSEYALEGPTGSISCQTEADIFRALDLHMIPPELRENLGEIELAEKGPLPVLVDRHDLTGTFHCHTDWSDGGSTLEEMAEAARAAGLHYLGIADHSKSAAYAGGLNAERVREQWQAIDRLNDRYGDSFRLFKGTECDILPDGSLDFPDELLAGFDYVVASVHSSFRMSREAMTNRIIKAVRHPLVTMLGHPTGRLLLARDAYPLDMSAIIAAAADSQTMIEINANPHRLDLDDLYSRAACAQGINLVINPDAHSVAGLADLDFGIGQARRAGLTKQDVFNTRPLAEIQKALARGKKSSL